MGNVGSGDKWGWKARTTGETSRYEVAHYQAAAGQQAELGWRGVEVVSVCGLKKGKTPRGRRDRDGVARASRSPHNPTRLHLVAPTKRLHGAVPPSPPPPTCSSRVAAPVLPKKTRPRARPHPTSPTCSSTVVAPVLQTRAGPRPRPLHHTTNTTHLQLLPAHRALPHGYARRLRLREQAADAQLVRLHVGNVERLVRVGCMGEGRNMSLIRSKGGGTVGTAVGGADQVA